MPTEHEPYAGVINPYALTEQVLGRRIDWKNIVDPDAVLENALRTPANKLFDAAHGSAPYAFAPGVDTIKVLKSLDKLPTPAARAPLGAIRGPIKISPLLHDPNVSHSNNTEFTPENAVWLDKGDFFEEGTETLDPRQGAVGDCYLIAALSSVAWTRPDAIVHRNRITGQAQHQFVNIVNFYNGNKEHRIEVTDEVPVSNNSHNFIYARSKEDGEIWPAVIEKAYAKWKTNNKTDKPPYAPIAGGNPAKACSELVKGYGETYKACSNTSVDNIVKFIKSNSAGGKTFNPMTAWTYAKASDAPTTIKYDNTTGIVGWHAYSVLGWQWSNNTCYVVLRNPWGRHEGKIDVLNGNWNPHMGSWTLTVPLNTDGVFSMKASTFKNHFRTIAVSK